MSSKETILSSIRKAGVPASPLADFSWEESVQDTLPLYRASLEKNGGKLIHAKEMRLAEHLKKTFSESHAVYCYDSSLVDSTITLDLNDDPHNLSHVDLAILPVSLAVAENAAHWLDDGSGIPRVLPFITQHLVLVLNKKDIVPTMHQAYARLDLTSGFGVFIAGPSKTADIEQSLVIGAHGARSLTVYLSE